MKELTLLGSHDAGCVEGYITEATSFPNRWAVTQSQRVHDQLCSGYRVFDIRFRKNGKKGWFIHHGKPGSRYWFQSLEDIGQEFQSFCNEGTGTELTVIRLKIEGSCDTACHNEVITALKTKIDGGAKQCIVSKAGQSFSGESIASLKRDGGATGSPVVIMPYLKGSARAVFTGPAEPIVFDYDVNQKGKATETLKVKVLLKKTNPSISGNPGQEYVRHKWAVAVAGGQPDLTFGFWFTMTGGIGSLDVRANSAKLFDDGKYKGWFYELAEKYQGKTMKGYVFVAIIFSIMSCLLRC